MISKEERFSRSLPCRFTADELRVKADELADKVAKREAMEDEKKSVAQDYKHRIDAMPGDITLLARNISQKQEHRQIECVAILDTPEYGQKSVYRTDSGELVGVEHMSAMDRQLAMQFDRDTNTNTNAAPHSDQDPIAAAEEVFAPSIDDGVVDHDTGGSSHEAEETVLEFLGQKDDEE
jgi:hypothetical protein